MLEINSLNIYIALAINGLATGVGVTLGSYLTTHGLINKFEKIIRKLKLKNGKIRK